MKKKLKNKAHQQMYEDLNREPVDPDSVVLGMLGSVKTVCEGRNASLIETLRGGTPKQKMKASRRMIELFKEMNETTLKVVGIAGGAVAQLQQITSEFKRIQRAMKIKEGMTGEGFAEGEASAILRPADLMEE